MPDPFALGVAFEEAKDPDDRTRRGAWFTPAAVARLLVDRALSAWSGPRPPRVVLDPSVGGGVFLLAAHERLPEARLVGIDIDAGAVAVTDEALVRAGATDVVLVHGDGLDPSSPPEGVDLVVGNPPFLSQLRTATTRDDDRRARVRGWYGEAAEGYVDESGLFVLAVSRLLSPGGVAVLVVPEALLATGSAARMREEVSSRCGVEVVWRDTDGVFPGVPTCALLLRRDRRGGIDGAQTGGASWAALLADDVPMVADPVPGATRTVGDLATATADFREAYYLVADHVREARPGHDDPRITPVGLSDPAHHRWGATTVRFAKQRWERPVAVDLPPAFLATRSGPKLLVATQTKVLEALVDTAGDMLPTTPAITVRTDRPWHVGAALTSPVLTALAARRHAGAARTRTALKLSAAQVLALPLPDDGPAWDAAAEAFRAAHDTTGPDERTHLLQRCGASMWTAYGLEADPAATGWWSDRLPRR